MKREPGQSRAEAGGLGAEEISAYLRAHPDFLTRHPELLEHLTPPSLRRGANVVDFQSHMVGHLRDQLTGLRDQQRELIATTRANLNNQNRIHAAILFLLDARSFEHLIQTITTDLAVLLDLDVACLVVESSGERDLARTDSSGVRVVRAGRIGHWLGRHEVVLAGQLEGDPELFGGGAGLVRSQVLVRLHVSGMAPPALLAFGSREPDMFHPGQGTELVGFLARVVERCLRVWLKLPP